jgi:hypothetical protein
VMELSSNDVDTLNKLPSLTALSLFVCTPLEEVSSLTRSIELHAPTSSTQKLKLIGKVLD